MRISQAVTSTEVVIAGNTKAKDTNKMVDALRRHFIPNKVVILRPLDQEFPGIDHIAEFVKYYKSVEKKPLLMSVLTINVNSRLQIKVKCWNCSM